MHIHNIFLFSLIVKITVLAFAYLLFVVSESATHASTFFSFASNYVC